MNGESSSSRSIFSWKFPIVPLEGGFFSPIFPRFRTIGIFFRLLPIVPELPAFSFHDLRQFWNSRDFPKENDTRNGTIPFFLRFLRKVPELSPKSQSFSGKFWNYRKKPKVFGNSYGTIGKILRLLEKVPDLQEFSFHE